MRHLFCSKYSTPSPIHPTRQLRSTEHVEKMAKQQNVYMTKCPHSKILQNAQNTIKYDAVK